MSELSQSHIRRIAEDLLSELESLREAAGFDAQWRNETRQQLNPPEQEQVAEALRRCLDRLQATNLAGPANHLPSQILWKTAGEVLSLGKLQLHARAKPRGYAGDDLLLTQVFEQAVCNHPLGQAFDKFFQQQDACQAVRGRIRRAAEVCLETLESVAAVANRVVEQRVSVIGAGPALEMELVLRGLLQSHAGDVSWLTITLFDLDETALQTAQARLQAVTNQVPITLVRENLFRLAKQPQRAAALRQSSCILCLGLLDYLKESDAADLLRLCYQNLIPGGQMLIGNFSPNCQARAYMEWIGNWYLLYRSPDALRQLATEADIPADQISMETESSGVNLLLRVRKAGLANWR